MSRCIVVLCDGISAVKLGRYNRGTSVGKRSDIEIAKTACKRHRGLINSLETGRWTLVFVQGDHVQAIPLVEAR